MPQHPGLRDVGRTTTELSSAGRADEEQVRLLAAVLRCITGPRSTTDQASHLIARFGSIPAVLRAEPALLREVAGVGPATIGLFAAVAGVAEGIARRRAYGDRPILSASSELMDYLHLTMAFLPVEQARVIFLNKRNRLIADEVLQTGTVDHTPFYLRQIIKRALDLAASALILVHNHPSGDPSPSSIDVRTTREIMSAAKPLGITIHDHIIIAKSGHSSLRTLKLLDRP